ncbi:MAG TPA: acyltransferase [Accumulibacter sp.]|nr:acyltransferase [Accumulibacter sp.]
MSTVQPRLAFIDLLKAVACQLIVLHHLAFYGPMSDHAYPLAPALMSWLSQHARMAVQVFLVIGGFLAARSLAPEGRIATIRPFSMVIKRYLKLAIPYLAAVLIGMCGAALARLLMTHDSVPAAPTWPQLIAHVLFLQSILGYDGLSAGVWYVAIDFQLFTLLLGLLWLAERIGGGGVRTTRIACTLIVALALMSLYHFNRDGDWDMWGVYFFAAYALGALTHWATNGRQAVGWLLTMALVVVLALLLDYRPRIAIALLAALALALARRCGILDRWPDWRGVLYLGRISYAVFLIHFPVCLLVNGLFTRFASTDPWINSAGLAVAWIGSLVGGALFYRYIENPAQRVSTRYLPTPGVSRQA